MSMEVLVADITASPVPAAIPLKALKIDWLPGSVLFGFCVAKKNFERDICVAHDVAWFP